MLDTYTTVTRLLLAFVFGGIIGYERESKGGLAGLRTHILVCIGSALIMLVSLYVHKVYGSASADPGRIAAGVVTGIGFLCAGTIIRNPQGVIGLTTAASIWVSAAIGLSIGCGYLSASLTVTLITYFCLRVLKYLEKDNKDRTVK